MERVRAQRCGLVAAGSNQRYRHSRNVDDQRNLDDSEDVSPRLELVSALGQPHGRFDHDEYATVGQDRGLAERAQILGSPVPVRMIPIGRADPEADREESQDRGHYIARGPDARGHETQTAGQDPVPSLSNNQYTRCADRYQHGARLRHCLPGCGFPLAIGCGGRLGSDAPAAKGKCERAVRTVGPTERRLAARPPPIVVANGVAHPNVRKAPD